MSENELVKTQIYKVKKHIDREFKAYATRYDIPPGELFEKMWLAFLASEQSK